MCKGRDKLKSCINHILFWIFVAVTTVVTSSCSKDKGGIKQETTNTIIPSDGKGFTEILCRPENTSVTVSILFDQPSDVYWEYGTASGNYTKTTLVVASVNAKPLEAVLSNLTPNTYYFYRTRYRLTGTTATFEAGIEHTFYTQRSAGNAFTFTIESDEHLYDKKGVQSIYQICLNNQALDKPDFMLSLGDIFGDDHQATTITSAQLDALHKFYRPFLGSICHSIPFMVCIGNHEGENDYYMSLTPPNNLAINGTLWRNYYFPNPYPDGFYSGNSEIERWGIGHPENYYAWTWGDALFVVLDVYRYENKGSDKPQGWDWTLGQAQYNWLKTILEGSTSKYKFVFAHHVRGQGRGGITNAKLYEWGGYEENGTIWGFTANRPGMAKPIHRLFVDNHLNIYFQGHDHVFAHEVLDGVTYQAMPMPSDSTYQIGILANGDAYTSDVVGGTGHLRVNVSSSEVKVDFVQAYLPNDENGTRKNRQVAFSYTIK